MSSSNRASVPEARAYLDQLKFEIAGEQGINLKDGYNGDLTAKQNGTVGDLSSRDNGYVGGYMVKRMIEEAQGIK